MIVFTVVLGNEVVITVFVVLVVIIDVGATEDVLPIVVTGVLSAASVFETLSHKSLWR